jgi:CRISPR/Cas system-associated protein Cas10 (large subunit of type III CRISPR-Cas system)
MTGTLIVDVSGGCPVCGNPDIKLPELYEDATEIVCAKCQHRAPYAEFFARDETGGA